MRRPRRKNETPAPDGVGVSSSFAGQQHHVLQQQAPDFQSPQYRGPENQAGGNQPAGYRPGELQYAEHQYAGRQAAPAASAETVVARVRRHGRRLTLPVLVLVAVAAASGYFVGSFPELWMNVLAGAGAAILLIAGGIGPILKWLARRVVVTTRRVIVHQGFFVRHRSEVSLARVREVRSKQNPIQRVWGSGDIDLFVGTESTRIPDAPGMKELHAAIQELSERSYDEHVRSTGFGF